MIDLGPRYYKRTMGLFDPGSKEPFKISRSKIDLFVECPRCFYLDRRFGAPRPSMPGFTLNSAVDHLLKKEFDIHRNKGEAHPLMKSYGIDAIPYAHKDLEIWRHNFTGIQFHERETNFLVFGAIDDVWQGKDEKLHIVDYKATSKKDKPTLDGFWQEAYKRQMEIYQWLFSKNGFNVSSTGYFVYVNGKKDKEAFDGKLEFDIDIIPYEGDSSWVSEKLKEIKIILMSGALPEVGNYCEYCPYRELAGKSIRESYGK